MILYTCIKMFYMDWEVWHFTTIKDFVLFFHMYVLKFLISFSEIVYCFHFCFDFIADFILFFFFVLLLLNFSLSSFESIYFVINMIFC